MLIAGGGSGATVPMRSGLLSNEIASAFIVLAGTAELPLQFRRLGREYVPGFRIYKYGDGLL